MALVGMVSSTSKRRGTLKLAMRSRHQGPMVVGGGLHARRLARAAAAADLPVEEVALGAHGALPLRAVTSTTTGPLVVAPGTHEQVALKELGLNLLGSLCFSCACTGILLRLRNA